MQAVTLELVTPVPQGAHWLIRKQVHNLASQIASQHFYHHLRWAVDGRRLTAPLLKKQLGCALHSGKHVQTGLSKQKGCEPLISCAREVHTHTDTDTHTHKTKNIYIYIYISINRKHTQRHKAKERRSSVPQTQTVLEGLLEPGPAHAQTKTKEFSQEFGLSPFPGRAPAFAVHPKAQRLGRDVIALLLLLSADTHSGTIASSRTKPFCNIMSCKLSSPCDNYPAQLPSLLMLYEIEMTIASREQTSIQEPPQTSVDRPTSSVCAPAWIGSGLPSAPYGLMDSHESGRENPVAKG